MGTNQKTELYEFAGFRLDEARRILVRQGQPVDLAPKVFDTLLFLVQNSGRVLEKDEFMKALWPDSFVEEGNLSQNIFVLRRTLGDDRNGNSLIQTIPRRGYRFVASVKHIDASAPENASLIADYWNCHSPFRSLQVFEPQDAWLFFGRNQEVGELVARLGRSPVLVVAGNSGCGKSSLVRAGLMPALQADSWRIAVLRPSASPFDYLAETLASQLAPGLSLKEHTEFIANCRDNVPSGRNALRNAVAALITATTQREKTETTHVLLVADQFEEIFTLTSQQETRASYINALLEAGQSGGTVAIHVVLVLRADFYAQCLEHEKLGRCLQTNLYNVPRMSQDQLRESIERRLQLAASQAEAGLIDNLLEEVGAEPGNLALLEHALGQLWDKCGGFGCTLTNQAYTEIGRLRGALGRHADEVYASLGDERLKHLAQKTFLELVHLGEDAVDGARNDTRRRVSKADLLALGDKDEMEQLLARLASRRLISTGDSEQTPFVEVSHEALIREWPVLREWIETHRDSLRLERRLRQAAQEWKDIGRDSGALLQGARLAQGREWLARYPEAAPLVREFVETSTAARVKAEEQKLRRLRWLSYGLGALLVLALGVSWIIHKRHLLAESRLLAGQSEEMLTRDPGRALDLAIRAWNIAKTQEAYLSVTKALPQTLNIINQGYIIGSAVFSPSGERVFTSTWAQPTGSIWNAVDGRLLVTLRDTTPINAAQFSPDGQRVVTAGRDHAVRVWNAADGTFQGYNVFAFSPDGCQIVIPSADHTAQVRSATNGHLLATLHHQDAVCGAVFSPDRRHFITGSFDHTARLWNSADGRMLATFRHDASVGWAAFSPDGQQVVTASEDHTARVWNVTNGRLLATLQHESRVVSAEFSSNGSYIITANENRARIWSNPDGRLLATLPGHAGELSMATFSPDGQFIITAGLGTRVWNTAGGRAFAALQGHTAAVMAAQFSPDGHRVVTASWDHTARTWNVGDGRLIATLQGHTAAVVAAQFSPDGQRVVTAGDSTARIWSVSDGRLLATLQGHKANWALTAAQFSPDGQHVVTASSDSTARIWNVTDGSLLATLQGHTEGVEAAQFSPDGQRVVTASADHTARIWNVGDGRLLAILQGHNGQVPSATFSPNGQWVVTASLDHTARIWRVSDGRLLATLQGHTAEVATAQFSPDGQRVVTASADHTARVWNANDGRLLSTLEGHKGRISAATFSPNGRYILTASYDQVAGVWNSSDGHLVALLQGHNGPLQSAMFASDGRSIVTASDDQTARIWQVLTLSDVERILTK